eukprot:gene5272-6569_t
MGIGVFAGTIFLSTLLPSGFLPANDISRSMLSIELPPGTTIHETQAAADRITALLMQEPEVASVYATAGGGGQGGLSLVAGEVRNAQIVINLKPRDERDVDQKTFETRLAADLKAIPDIRFTWSQDGQNAQRGFSIILSGNDGEAVERTALMLEKEVRDQVPLLANVVSSAALDRPEIRIVPKLDEAAELHGLLATDKLALPGMTGAGFAWIVPGLVLAAIVALAYLRWVLRQPAEIRNLFFIAGTIYVT